jgi:Flp pilus assembly protein TadD
MEVAVVGDLSVQVRLNGIVVEDRVIEVKEPVVVGDYPGASLVFPGASVRVQRAGAALSVLGRTLMEGEEVELTLPRLTVVLGHTRSAKPFMAPSLGIDIRFFTVALVVVLIGSWVDSAGALLLRMPGDGERQLPVQSEAGQQRAALTAGSRGGLSDGVEDTDGPAHMNDDRSTRVAYHQWLRRATPEDPAALEADHRLDSNPEDSDSRRLVARAAYNEGHFGLSAWHYRQILNAHPSEPHASIRLAWSLRRQGHHRAELALYRTVLTQKPNHALALSGKSMAEVRLGMVDEAQSTLDRLQMVAPTHPYIEVTAAFVEASSGESAHAIASLSRAVAARESLNKELQLELRRDMAIDPMFASLRAERTLLGMLRRHLGAAAPRNTR